MVCYNVKVISKQFTMCLRNWPKESKKCWERQYQDEGQQQSSWSRGPTLFNNVINDTGAGSVKGGDSSHWARHKGVNLKHLLLPQEWDIAKKEKVWNIICEKLGNVEDWVIGKKWNFFQCELLVLEGVFTLLGKYPLCCALEFWSPRHPGYEKIAAQMASSLPRYWSRVFLSGWERCMPESHPTEHTSVGTRGSLRCTYLEVQTEWWSHDQEKVGCDWRTELARYFK